MAQANMVDDEPRRGKAALSTYLRYARPDHLHPARPRAGFEAWPCLAGVVAARIQRACNGHDRRGVHGRRSRGRCRVRSVRCDP